MISSAAVHAAASMLFLMGYHNNWGKIEWIQRFGRLGFQAHRIHSLCSDLQLVQSTKHQCLWGPMMDNFLPTRELWRDSPEGPMDGD